MPSRVTKHCTAWVLNLAPSTTQRQSRASQTLANFWRKPNKQYHTENQGQKDNIVKISSILQRQKIPEGIRIRLENNFSSTGNSKNPYSRPKTCQNKNGKKFSEIFGRSPVSRLVPKTLRSPLCSQNVSFLVKIKGGGFDENKLEKSRIEKTLIFETKIGYNVLGCRKPNLRQKLFILKNLTMPKTVKGAL